MKLLTASISLALFASAATAQSPYEGMQTRPIKGLSEQRVADLKAGRGMGLALPANSTAIRVRHTCLNWPTNSNFLRTSGRVSKPCSTT
jgi:hypothetical protein